MKFIVFFLVLSMNVFAGDRVGNGGGTHYCPQKDTAEFYDLFEARTRYQMGFDEKLLEFYCDRDIDDYLIQKLAYHNPYMAKKVSVILKRMEQQLVFLSNIDLKEIEDANFLMTEKGCKYAQLANWDETIGKIFIDEELYQKLPYISKTALRWHEAIYKFFREVNRANNSDYTRKVVGKLFDRQLMGKVYDLDYNRTDYPWFEIKGYSGYATINIPQLTFAKSLKVKLETFSDKDQTKLNELIWSLPTTKRKDKVRIKKEIKFLESMKARNFCLTIKSITDVRVCKGDLIDANVNVIDSLGFRIDDTETPADFPIYLRFFDEEGAEHEREVLMTLPAIKRVDDEGWVSYIYNANVIYTFGKVW